MLNKPLIAVLALVIVVIIAAGIYAGSNQIKPSSQANDNIITSTNDLQNSHNDSSVNNTGQSMISASDAQNIALKYIEEPNATAGTPRLVDEDGNKFYVVPVVMGGKTVGQIEIDAYTGANVGGAGGA